MRVQDEVLLASAAIWDLDCPSAFAWLQMSDSSLADIVSSITVPVACSGSLRCRLRGYPCRTQHAHPMGWCEAGRHS